jgi:hypothetical protein
MCSYEDCAATLSPNPQEFCVSLLVENDAPDRRLARVRRSHPSTATHSGARPAPSGRAGSNPGPAIGCTGACVGRQRERKTLSFDGGAPCPTTPVGVTIPANARMALASSAEAVVLVRTHASGTRLTHATCSWSTSISPRTRSRARSHARPRLHSSRFRNTHADHGRRLSGGASERPPRQVRSAARPASYRSNTARVL